MERAARTLAKMKSSGQISAEELACAAWPVAVGKTIARHSAAVSLVRDKLVIEVEDAIWQKQLFHLQIHILRRVHELLGPGLIADLEFRIAKQRRPPQRETRLPESADESDRIEDPVLRIVYRQARKRATA
jgi:predicted nucleic acid-binding Zn ribbon protein